MAEERVYTIPLRDCWLAPRNKRAKKAVKIIREFIERHVKAKEVKIDQKLNEKIWERGIQKPPRRVKVKVKKDEEGVATVYLAEEE